MQNKPITMILLQADEEAAALNQKQFSALGVEIVAVCGNGDNAVQIVHALRPDVVLMDGFLPGRSADEIIRLLRMEGGMRHAVIAVLSSVSNDLLAQQVTEAGCDLFLLTPLDYPYIRNRFIELLDQKRNQETPVTNDRFALERYIAELMHDIGIPARVRGYAYIRDSILLVLESRDLLQSITHGLYPAVAERNDSTVSRVERSIRHAIQMAWDRGDIDQLHRIFGFTVSSKKGRPSNAEFISIVTERIRLEHRIL